MWVSTAVNAVYGSDADVVDAWGGLSTSAKFARSFEHAERFACDVTPRYRGLAKGGAKPEFGRLSRPMPNSIAKKEEDKKPRLLAFIQHGVNSHATGMWRNTKGKTNCNGTRPPYWQRMARRMERGLFSWTFPRLR
jgi:hypothetical protein